MDNVQWAIKPFSKHFTPATFGTASSDTIQLTDTEGNLVDCNYVSIKATAGSITNAGGYIFVRPSIGYAAQTSFLSIYVNSDIGGAGSNPNGAGEALGGVIRYFRTDVRNEPIIIRTSGSEMFNEVIINSITTIAPDYEITYGVIYPANSLETLKTPTRGQ